MDSTAGFTTLPMRLGETRTKKLYAILIFSAYVALVAAATSKTVHVGILLPLLSLPLAWKQVQRVLVATRLSLDLADAPPQTAGLYLLFGGLLAAGLALPF